MSKGLLANRQPRPTSTMVPLSSSMKVLNEPYLI